MPSAAVGCVDQVERQYSAVAGLVVLVEPVEPVGLGLEPAPALVRLAALQKGAAAVVGYFGVAHATSAGVAAFADSPVALPDSAWRPCVLHSMLAFHLEATPRDLHVVVVVAVVAAAAAVAEAGPAVHSVETSCVV